MTGIRKQRGYNLVEIMIVLTVAAMMGSWLVANFYQYQKNQRVAETERTIESIKQGLVEYAAQNRAKEFTVLSSYENAQTLTVTVRWQMPAGRPYLPCPDITGDGIEDRVALTVVGVYDYDSAIDGYRSLREYECYLYKGMVPWRTIGAPSADLWGNHFTYRIDPDFANSLFGFDQETNASDSGNHGLGTRGPVKRTLLSSGQTVALITDMSSPGTEEIKNFSQPIFSNNNVTVAWGGARVRDEYAPSIICVRSPCSYEYGAIDNLLVGEIVTVATMRKVGGYRLDIPVMAFYGTNSMGGNIINGVPVVILSHGENGYGAVIDDNDDNTQLKCRQFPNTIRTDYQDERQNAQSYQNAEGGGCPAIEAHTMSRNNGFVKRVHTGIGDNISSERQGFDDIVGWMGTEELRSKLIQQNVFPVEKLPPVGLEGY